MVTWDDVSFKSWLNEVRNRRTYAVAVVVEIQDLEGNSGLRTLASLEVGAGIESS